MDPGSPDHLAMPDPIPNRLKALRLDPTTIEAARADRRTSRRLRSLSPTKLRVPLPDNSNIAGPSNEAADIGLGFGATLPPLEPTQTTSPASLLESNLTSEHRESMPSKANKQNADNQQYNTVKDALEAAFDAVVQAVCLAKDRKEKEKLHELSMIHREHMETGRLNWSASILSQEVKSLEQVARTLGTKVKALALPTSLLINQQATPPTATTQASFKTPPKPAPKDASTVTWATVAKEYTGQEWTTVQKKKLPSSSKPQKKTIQSRQLVLIAPKIQIPTFCPLQTRNKLNEAFTQAGVKKPVVLTVTTTMSKKNLLVTTNEDFDGQYLIDNMKVWSGIIPHQSCQVNEPWHKVVIHGVPIQSFNDDRFGEMVKHEIQTYNKGLSPIGQPYWLTPASRMQTQRAGTIVVAFATEREATTAIRNRLYFAGRSLKVEALHRVAPSAQCKNCQGFGHLDARCRKKACCCLCAESHHTDQHVCSSCSTKGKTCVHTLLKCANCDKTHTANDPKCEVFRAIKDHPHHL